MKLQLLGLSLLLTWSGCNSPTPATTSVKSFTALTRGFPETLAETELFDASNSSRPVAGFVSFEVRAPLWSDGAKKQRYVYVPEGKHIRYLGTAAGFDFPIGTMFAKYFSAGTDDHGVETRIIVKKEDGNWAFVTYMWNTDGTATLSGTTRIENFNGQNQAFHIPSNRQCQMCHHQSRGYVLGFRPEQLNFDAGDGETQLTKLIKAGVIEDSTGEAQKVISYLDPYDAKTPLDDRARTYLEVNCASCHNPSSEVTLFDLSIATPFAETKLVKGKYIRPGDPAGSTLWQVITSDKPDIRMPPTSLNTDARAADFLKLWIEQIKK